MRRKISILGKEYTKKELLQKCKEILHKYKIGERLHDEDFKFMYEIIKLHPNSNVKLSQGIKAIEVNVTPYNNIGFFIISSNEKKIDFSFYKSLGIIKEKNQNLNALRDIHGHGTKVEHVEHIVPIGVLNEIVYFETGKELWEWIKTNDDHTKAIKRVVTNSNEINNLISNFIILGRMKVTYHELKTQIDVRVIKKLKKHRGTKWYANKIKLIEELISINKKYGCTKPYSIALQLAGSVLDEDELIKIIFWGDKNES